MDKVKRIKELTEQLNEYRDSYYNESVSLISDYEYDNLFDELSRLEKEENLILANSPTQSVGYEVKSELVKVKHSHPMMSLDKTKDVNELKKFAGNQDCILSLKMDGLTILLKYDNGELIQAETRGNGEEGELITHNAKVFDNIPLTISYLGALEIEGEAIITYEDFDAINSKILIPDDKYKNPRNLASGSVRQLDSEKASQRHIKFIAWKVPYIQDKINGDSSYLSKLKYVQNLGFDIVPLLTYKNGKFDDQHITEMICNLKLQAEKLAYPIDGLVITYDDIEYGKSLGMTGHHPKHSLAFKFYDEEVESRLIKIDWTCGKTGVLTPTAVFEPVDIDGTTVERASLHNISIMNSLSDDTCWYKDMTVNVYKANAIIPQISSVEIDVNTRNSKSIDELFYIPSKCPVCGEPTKIAKDNDTEVLICTNDNCKGKLLKKIEHFCSKNAIDIEGLSEATIEFLINEGWLSCFKDIFSLSNYKIVWYEEYVGFGEKSVNKLLRSIENSRKTTLSRFIYSLSIPLIGRTASKDISKYFNNNYDDFYNNGINTDFTNIDGIGDERNHSIHSYLKQNLETMNQLAEIFEFEQPKAIGRIDDNKKIKGLSFVITGTLNIFSNRDEAKERIEELGGKVSGTVTRKTDFLVNNNEDSTSSKNKKAKELGIPIISEEQLVKML